ncbi:MAG: ketoacyl-ACP synthase III [Chlorobi bacterium]|nr:ketoacyl-ACP synthase III [Chlorobiota bacterium]
MRYINTIITGTGSYIPSVTVKNSDFEKNKFYDEKRQRIEASGKEIIEKFKAITGIEERRYASDDLNTSDIGAIAAERAIKDAGIDPETIDQIIVAHNFGDVRKNTIQTDIVPSLASRIKHRLKIENPACIPYDILFGCPGWIQGVIQANAYIKSGLAKRCLVIGNEALSRVLDKHDRDSMIYSDGAGASIVEAVESNEIKGFLSSSNASHTKEEAYYLFVGKSNFPNSDENIRYLKMLGRKIYEYSISNVPKAMKEALDKAGIDISEVKKILIHQANEKMDEAMIKRLYRLYGKREIPENIMPMSIHKLGNSSVATIPTLLDMLRNDNFEEHHINENDILLFASVGAGMNINSFVYKY